MKKQRVRALLSSILIVLILLPQISVGALELNKNEGNNGLNEPVITDNKINEEKLNLVESGVNSEKVSNTETSTEENKNVSEQNETSIEKNKNVSGQNKTSAEQNKADKSNLLNEDISKKELAGQLYEYKNEASTFSLSEERVYEREEFNLKQETFKDIEKLQTKTDANYEVALAYNDGSYLYVDSAENVEEAMNKVESINSDENFVQAMKKVSDSNDGQAEMKVARNSNEGAEEEGLPVILNSKGSVVYSTKSMGRILKHIDGKVYPYFDINTNIYSDSSLTRASAYINQGYVDDVPIIEDAGTSAKILVSGYQGWINKNINSSEYDMIVVPINQVTNPSYYMSENGVLKHFITSDLRATYEKGYTIEIGAAPSYLKSGVKYLSYDGNYFYDGSDIAAGLNNLIADLQNNTHGNSINTNNPNYTYYNYLPFRSRTNYTAGELDKFINERTEWNSKLRGTGAAFIDAENKFGVNALLALGIAMNESGLGMSSISQSKNNIFGINAVDSNPGQAADSYATVKDCIYEFAKNVISRGYSDPADWRYFGGFLGNKKLGANVKYASDPFWGEKAGQYAFSVDYKLSNENISNLKDNDYYQLAIYTDSNEVKNSNGSLLYNVRNNFSEYSTYVGVPVVVVSMDSNVYKINPERNTPVGSGGINNMYHGNYDFNDKGYVRAQGIKLINKPTNKGEWIHKDGKWYYRYSDGSVHKGWLYWNDKKYYFDKETGVMKTEWYQEGDTWYYFYPSSGSAATGWTLASNNHWYYFYSDGTMAKGWITVNGYNYYLYDGGSMATDWVQYNGNWYYMYKSGEMATGWTLAIDKHWYYFYSDGTMARGWLQDGKDWYYLYDGGSMATGWVRYYGKWYYMYKNGAMATGWVTVDGSLYYFKSGSGQLQE